MSTDLNVTVLALQIEQGVKFIKVRFHKENGDFDLNGPIDPEAEESDTGWSPRQYLYKVDPELHATLSIGDLVVVPARNHFQVVKVSELDAEIDFGAKIDYRWVIANVTERLKFVQDAMRRENKAKQQITSARLRREAVDILKTANLSSEDIQLLGPITGQTIRAAAMPELTPEELETVQALRAGRAKVVSQASGEDETSY